jgi:hypothetical protein
VRFPIGLDAAEGMAVKIKQALAKIRDGDLERAPERASRPRDPADDS